MEFRILGPLEVRHDGHLVELRRHKQRALLAFLLLHAGEWLSADALIEALWGEHSPKTARAALQGYIAQLRRVLGTGVIATRDGGYELELGPGKLDLERFESLVGEARGGEGDERIAKLQAALELWRGPPLADLVYEPFADREAARLEELRVTALEELVDAELLQGEGPELVERLDVLVGEHPYRERLRGQLMLALYRSGRQVEALDCYRHTRETLVEELGIEPADALRELEQAILRQDPSLQPASLGRELPPLAERRKAVTVLFAELLLPDALDPELQRRRSTQALSRVRTVLGFHGAAVEQRASEELLAVFGLPLAHEDDALRAARAALELTSEPGIELRVALESGEVLAGADEAGHGFVSGLVVPAARHLLERAGPGETLIGEVALGLLHGVASTEPREGAGPRRLEGLDEQALVVAQPEAPLAGRRNELATLHAAFSNTARNKTTRLFLLVGEAGIGKTRLAAELASELEARATIAHGRCLSYGQALTYWPLVEALRSLGAPALAAVEELTTGAVTSPLQLAATVGRALKTAAAERPLLLLLEDVHWGEPALLELLELLCERPDEAPILLLCLARPQLLERYPDWAGRESLRLDPLPRPDANALLDALAEPLEARQRKRVLARAAGNPLFLEELSAFIAAGGDPGDLPPRLQVLLQARLDLLPESQRLLLSCAALEGTVFHRGALAALTDHPELDAELGALTQTRLIRRARADLSGHDGYRFRHGLIRDTAYAELPKMERARLHERFADWLATRTGERAELEEIVAYHLEQAALTRRELDAPFHPLEQRAAEALAGVAERAALRVDRRAAADLWRRTLVLLAEDDARRPELELELGLALTPLAEFREAVEVLERAKRRTSDLCLAARIRVAEAHVRLYHDPEAVTEAIEHECLEAIALFEEHGDHRALAFAWFALAEAEWFDLRSDAERAYEQAAAQARLAGDRGREMFALAMRTVIRAVHSISYATAVAEADHDAARFPDDPIMGHCLDHMRSCAAYDLGDVANARPLARSAAAGIRRWAYRVIAASLDVGFPPALELLNGQVDEAERLILKGIAELEELEERKYLSWAKAQLAMVRVAQKRFDEALELADEVRRFAGHGRRAEFRAWAASADAHLGLGDIEQAKAAAAKAVAVVETTESIEYRAQAQLGCAAVLAATGECPAALEAAREAACIWTTLDRKLLGARTAALIEQLEHAMGAAGAPA